MNEDVLVFDREAVGIKKKQMWTDNQTFINISHGVKELIDDVAKAAPSLPEDTVGGVGKTDNNGTLGLRNELKIFIETLEGVSKEFSDACGVLGSGAEVTIGDMDSTESKVTADFEFMMSAKATPVPSGKTKRIPD